eukprot:TRINITY_DN266_c0_g1_i1.p1 TRINITY_DN266_c0_g1~~TRINITY_DN266_c0_g1_i1.p1  ORF type:complete len:511 (+),score=75.62 TRINITY_DN266_c0_g1_i1:201-1535(+)
MAPLSGPSVGRNEPGVTRRVVFSAMVAMTIFACLVHPAWAEGTPGRRHLLQGDEVLTAPLPICATLVDTRLIAECRSVLMTTPSADFTPSQPGETCETHARNVVITKDQMNLYYILDQFCMVNGSRSKQSLSYWSADLRGVDTGMANATQGMLLTHWWNSSALNGPAEMQPTIFQTLDPSMPAMAPMVYAYGLDLSPKESHLYVSAFALDSATSNISWVVVIDVANGSRVSIPVGAHLGYGLALNPARTHLYLSDAATPTRILVANMTGIEMITTTNFHPMALVNFAPQSHVSRPIFNAHSFTKDGSCLYFIDDRNNEVLGFNVVTETVTILTRRSESALLVESDGAMADINGGADNMFGGSLGEVATTSDGLYVFVSEFGGKLWRITLEEACGAPLSKTLVATYQGGGVWGLVVSSDDIYMYVGTADGHITRLGLNLPTATPG